ncbi:carcinine hydrolase/isopenicillin-N N-acyltransferase family protein [Vibrio hannami]|nr:carcinine hydrolase/isopenicillin-N N-acyltransferase family protein [Vibrio hannami]MDG3086418.1 carcinine hydrolase/isopenicillin-N N-acyltransferase family protein [Vibrio hannami]
MSDEAVFESQRSGGLGFLEEGKKKDEAPAKCTVMGKVDGKGKGWGVANFDYMGINYEGLMYLNHTNEKGETKIVQTWIGLIPYGGVTAGGQPLLMNTMSDEGTARQYDNGPILADNLVPSYKMSWDVYNAKTPEEVKEVFDAGPATTYFSYIILDAEKGKVANVENGYKSDTRFDYAQGMVHSNHSRFVQHEFVKGAFGGHTVEREQAGQKLLDAHGEGTKFADVLDTMQSKPLYKGRGEMIGTVTTIFYDIDGKKVDMSIYTDKDHDMVHIKNY